MGLFGKVAANFGIQTDSNVDLLDVASYARLPADHPVVLLADRAATRGLGATDLELGRFFGDPVSRENAAPVAPRAETPARYNWVARRTIDQMTPRLEENHVDRRIPREVRLAMAAVAADMIDPFASTEGSVISARLRSEAAMSKRVVGYLQATPDEIARRAAGMLERASDAGLRAEFELVPGTTRIRIPQDSRGRTAWIEERARTERALAEAGALPAAGILDAATRMDIVAGGAQDSPLMDTYVYPEILRDAAMSLDEANAFSDIDLRFRFKELGGMGTASIPSGPDRGDWVMSMLIEERQSQLMTGEQRQQILSDRKSVEATLPQPQLTPQQQQKATMAFAFNVAQAAGL
ncbi:hypothetical protein [Sphingomonas sp. 3-13AW]|uniref:hypothetical protein n=1 Tax=Sphingomonas sp. 3-13AW TaxID=3050450 RepID=UPI003BB7F161